MAEEHRISIWFFIGSLLTVYGVIIVVASLPALLSPATHRSEIVLPGLHAGVWWGALLVVLGLVYVVVFWPWKKKGDAAE